MLFDAASKAVCQLKRAVAATFGDMAAAQGSGFPFWHHSLPPFPDMFRELVNEKFTGGPAAGCARVLTRTYPGDHRRVDGISNHFTEGERIKGRMAGFPSPLDTWATLSAESLAGMSAEEKREAVYSCTRECNAFNPALAALLYRSYGATGGNVLDLSAGWGDRAIAAGAVGARSYFGFDPNAALMPCYARLADAVNEQQRVLGMPETHYTFTCDPAEADAFPSGTANVALLSPPFFDLEVYAEPGTPAAKGQSIEGRDSYAVWREEFLVPYLKRAATALMPGGALAVYVEDVRRPGGALITLQRDTITIADALPALARGGDFGLQVFSSSDVTDMRGSTPAAAAAGKQPARGGWKVGKGSRSRAPRVRRAMVWIALPIPETDILVSPGGGQHVDVQIPGIVRQMQGASGQTLHVVRPVHWGYGAWAAFEFPKSCAGVVLSVPCTEEDIASVAYQALKLERQCEIVLCAVDHAGRRHKEAAIRAMPWVIAASGYGANVTIAGDWRAMCAEAKKHAATLHWIPSTLTPDAAGVAAKVFAERTAAVPGLVRAKDATGAPTVWVPDDQRLVKLLTMTCQNPIRIVPGTDDEKSRQRLARDLLDMCVPVDRVRVHMCGAAADGSAAVSGSSAASGSAAEPLVEPCPPFINALKCQRLWDEARRAGADGDIIMATPGPAPLV